MIGKNNGGKVYVVGIGIFALLIIVGVLEFQYGNIQKAIYKYKVKNYLEQTYNEKMVVKKVSYLWDNIEPISARVYPKDAEQLEFTVYPSKEQANVYYDDYAEIVWLHQAKEDVDMLLADVDSEFKDVLFIDFTCCMEGDRVRVSNGEVTAYSEANLKFDLTFQLDRGMQAGDLEQIVEMISKLKQHEQLEIGNALFILQPEDDNSSRIEYKFSGKSLKEIQSIEDLDAFNESGLSAGSG